MKRAISRDFNYDEETDFKRNVLTRLDKYSEAVPYYDEEKGMVLGWIIQTRYE